VTEAVRVKEEASAVEEKAATVVEVARQGVTML
jgi:hypothetical protein